MERPIMTAIEKLVLAGEQAGFSVEQMIQLLQTGGTVETLLQLNRVAPIAARGRAAPVALGDAKNREDQVVAITLQIVDRG